MNDERMQILKMVQAGKLSPEEASRLLEAVEQPAPRPAGGPKPTHIRVMLLDEGRPKSFSVGMGLARWLLSVPGLMVLDLKGSGYKVDNAAILEAISTGSVGKVFEAQEGKKRVEIWLDP